jgi:hypothetical protein
MCRIVVLCILFFVCLVELRFEKDEDDLILNVESRVHGLNFVLILFSFFVFVFVFLFLFSLFVYFVFDFVFFISVNL